MINIYVAIILVLLALLVLSFRLAMSMARRAICTVISTFRLYKANTFETARSMKDLGLNTSLFQFRFFRDYRPWAFQTLVKAQVIRPTFDNLYFLSEDTLHQTPQIQCPPPSIEAQLDHLEGKK